MRRFLIYYAKAITPLYIANHISAIVLLVILLLAVPLAINIIQKNTAYQRQDQTLHNAVEPKTGTPAGNITVNDPNASGRQCVLLIASVLFECFSGVNQSDANNSLFGATLGWDRQDFDWAAYEPQRMQYNDQYLKDWGQKVLDRNAKGIQLLPVLGYNTSWSSTDGEQFSPLKADSVADWKNFIQRVVIFLHAPPYNVEYFQLWNEAHPCSGFWDGDMDTYMQNVHIPGAEVIRANGGKVVYGGWPACGHLNELISLLDKYNAWPTLDVVDIHYFNSTQDFDTLYDAITSRGYPNIGIWETEIGFTNEAAYIGNTYSRFLSWALQHNWSYLDKYKLFWFANWSPNDPKAFGYGNTLFTGTNLSPHGQSLKTIGNLFNGQGLRTYPVTVSSGEAEGFAMDSRIVVAVHVTPRSSTDVQLTLPKPAKPVMKVERVELSNNRPDITAQLITSSNGQNLTISVSPKDNTNSPAARWNQAAKDKATVFVSFELTP